MEQVTVLCSIVPFTISFYHIQSHMSILFLPQPKRDGRSRPLRWNVIFGTEKRPLCHLSNAVFYLALANSTKMCYTYDSLSRVTARTRKSLTDDSVISTEAFTYDAAGNVTDVPDNCFEYDTNNRKKRDVETRILKAHFYGGNHDKKNNHRNQKCTASCYFNHPNRGDAYRWFTGNWCVLFF